MSNEKLWVLALARRVAAVSVFTSMTWIANSSFVSAEMVYLNSGEIYEGQIVSANNRSITLKTPYGQLVVPKKDIARIEYEGGAAAAPGAASKDLDKRPARSLGATRLNLNIQGRSFWYAFTSPPQRPADTRIRLRFYLGSERVCSLVDSRPDTVDGNTLYNSFTFSPTDSQVVEVAGDYACRVEKAQDGLVVFRVDLPKGYPTGSTTARMIYEINEGQRSAPSWAEVVSRSFAFRLEEGREANVVVEQNSDALEYSGFLKKQMKNVELFDVRVIGAEIR